MYFESLYVIHQGYLNEMENLLDRYKIPKINRDQRDNRNNPTTPKEIEVVIEILPTTKGKKEQNQMFSVQNSIKPSKNRYFHYFSYYSRKFKQKEH